MTPEQLRTSIFQYALSGKLVPQIVAEGSAEELIKENIKIREQYIEANKIKKSKPLEEISDSEIPYEIPDNWKWVRIGDYCIDVFSGKSPKYSKTPTEYRIIGQAANQQEGLCYDQIKYTNEDFWSDMPERYFVKEYDVLLNTLGNGTLGRSGIVKELPHKLLTDGHLFVFRFTDHTEAMFLYYYLQYKRAEIERAANGSTNQTFLSLGNTLSWIIPIPPLKEQHRIVAKIEELLPYIDRYTEAYEKLNHFNAKFPEDMKKSILQYAIQGKLVEQRLEEGTSEELYWQIHDKKQKLLKEEKIKKEKPLEEIVENELPFDIPDTWKWCRLGELCINIQYGTSNKSQKSGDVPVLRMGNIQGGIIDYSNLVYTSNKEEIEKYKLDYNDLLFNRTNSKEWVGKTAIYKAEMPAIYAGYLVRITPLINSDYLNYVMQSQYYWIFCQRERTDAIGQSNINAEKLKKFIVPLPPLAEQERIVKKLNELLPYCSRLKDWGI